jgi:type IV secretory pathway TraG/TraD family ATPase VirD4
MRNAATLGLVALVAALLSFVAPSAIAQVKLLPSCTAGPITNSVSTPEDAESKACAAQNSVTAKYEPLLETVSHAVPVLTDANNRRDWKAYRAGWETIVPDLKALRDAASANPDTNGASNLGEGFGEGLGFTFKNLGLPPVGDLESASDAILKGLNGPNAQTFGTAGISIINSTVSRGTEFARGLANAKADKVRNDIVTGQTPEQLAQAKTISDNETGSTMGGYFGGFVYRLKYVAGPWFIVLFFVCVVGVFVAKRIGKNPQHVLAALVLAYLPASVVMVLLFLFTPFLGATAIVAVTLVLMVLTYFNGPAVFGWASRRVGGQRTETGRRLLVLGNAMRILRGQVAGQPAQAATPSPAPIAADKATHGTARFGTTAELASAHLVARTATGAAGLALARVTDAPAGTDPRFRFAGHVVTVAPTGSGKGIGQVIPNLLDYAGSMLVIDPKGENVAVTARARRQLGQAVHVIDPFGVTGQRSAAFNVLDRLDLASPDCVSTSAELAEALVIPADAKGGGGEAAHWDDTARTLLQGLLLHVAALDDPARRHLGELRRLLGGGEDEMLELWATMAADTGAGYGIPARAANTIMGVGDRERGSHMSGLRRHTAFLDDPRIVASLASSAFALDAIKTERMTVYLVLPANRLGPNARFLRLFIGATIAAVTASAAKPAQPVVLVLDEFAQLGYLRQLEDAVGLMRGYGLSLWVFLQDLSQLKGVYPRWQTFLANSAKVFFGTDDFDTAKYVSDSLGQSTIEFETTNMGSNTGSNAHLGGAGINRGRSTGTNQQLAGRALLTPDEVMRLGPERPLILVKGEYPYQLARLNYLTDPEYAGRFDANPYH